jgi:hypothetical protein
MNDLATVRGPRRTPPAGGLDRALANGRRRLRHRRVASTAATVSFAVVAGAAIAAGPRETATDRLDPAGDPHASGAAATPRGRAADAPPTALPSLPAGIPSLPTGSPAAAPSDTPSASATAPPAPPRDWLGAGSRSVAVASHNDPTACADPAMADPVARTGFCTAMTGPGTVRHGTPATFAFSLCRAAGQPAKTVTFSTREVALVAYRQDADPDWSLDDAAPKHTVSFAAGDCRTWTFEWMGQDAAGYAAPAGSYEVLGDVVADEWTDENGPDTPPPPASLLVDLG